MIEIDRMTARAGVILSQPGAWLEADGQGGYLVRSSPDRRRRAALRLCEAGFVALSREPGLSVRPEGGWRLVRAARPATLPAANRPSVVEGVRTCVGPDGAVTQRAVNLGESPIAWLARRRDANGRPWLRPVEMVAAEKLRDDFTLAGTVGRLTMAWDAGPKTRGGRGPGVDPAERARAAKARIARALDDVGPGLREVLVKVCFAGTALEAAERDLGLPRRAGKTVLKLALARLARHYGLG
ncbi:DUF6456 domain-containing protein [Caulobacter mirabilis]|uniref:DUF6456 domain-containing protein n=1 Tax=Caulobacter mirabilis TaxID=69666 RepID=A0A2D2AVD1_9CAUL|nr:DUF6456 domain-containing protein [Caulobacter mirabilis]ATQ41964.1 hypothetical protein CSW64_05830 [Caulobacter mirabilis]